MKKIFLLIILSATYTHHTYCAADDRLRLADQLHDAASAGNLARIKELNREGITLFHLLFIKNGVTVLQAAQPHTAAARHLQRAYDFLARYAMQQPPIPDHEHPTICKISAREAD